MKLLSIIFFIICLNTYFVNASELIFPENIKCSKASECNTKAYEVNSAKEAGKFITLKLKALEYLNYKKQNKNEYIESKEALSNMTELFLQGSLGMPGVFGGWMIQAKSCDELSKGAILLAYEAEVKREEDPYGIDRLADYQTFLNKIKKSADYDYMKAISKDPRKLSVLLMKEAKRNAFIIQIKL